MLSRSYNDVGRSVIVCLAKTWKSQVKVRALIVVKETNGESDSDVICVEVDVGDLVFGKLLILWWVEKVKGVRVVVVVEIVLVFVLLMLVLRWQCKEAIYNLSAGGSFLCFTATDSYIIFWLRTLQEAHFQDFVRRVVMHKSAPRRGKAVSFTSVSWISVVGLDRRSFHRILALYH